MVFYAKKEDWDFIISIGLSELLENLCFCLNCNEQSQLEKYLNS